MKLIFRQFKWFVISVVGDYENMAIVRTTIYPLN